MATITFHRLSELPDMIITTNNIFEVENVGVFKILLCKQLFFCANCKIFVHCYCSLNYNEQ